MKCPVDNETLVMTDRNGVEIDYCPRCRGVWLDRGELDKIIERTSPPEPQNVRSSRDHGGRDYDDRGGKPYRKKKESLWSEIFDF